MRIKKTDRKKKYLPTLFIANEKSNFPNIGYLFGRRKNVRRKKEKKTENVDMKSNSQCKSHWFT